MILITDEIWNTFEPFFYKTTHFGRPPKWSDRHVLEAVLYVLSNGLKWKDLPPPFPPKSTVYSRFRKWVDDGAFALLRDTLLLCNRKSFQGLKPFFVDEPLSGLLLVEIISVSKNWKGNEDHGHC